MEKTNLHNKIAEQAAEIALLRTGDTCARMCEGTAYRIEARQLKAQVERLRVLLREARSLVADNIGDAFNEDNNGWTQERVVLAEIDAALAEGK